MSKNSALILASLLTVGLSAGAVRAEEMKKSEKMADKKASGDAVAGTAQKDYTKLCQSCHGKDGKGNPGMTKAFKVELALLDLVDEATLAKTDEELIKITADGLNKMPAYKTKLSAKAIADLVAYSRTLKPAK